MPGTCRLLYKGEKKERNQHFLALLAGLREIKLIMSPFGVHMIMADCLQVFEDVIFVPGLVGGAWSLTLCDTRGGLVSNPTSVRNDSLFDSEKFKSVAVSSLVSMHLTSPGVSCCERIRQVSTNAKVTLIAIFFSLWGEDGGGGNLP